MKSTQAFLLLHNIRSAHNVGSIFRTADAAGISRIYLTGYTPQPIDRFGRPVKELLKTALGGESSVQWEYFENPVGLIRKLQKDFKKGKGNNKNKLQVVAIEQDKGSADYKKIKLKKQPVLFVVGNEVEGIEKKLLKRADVIAEIPMKGKKESLNIGVAFGVAVFRILNI